MCGEETESDQESVDFANVNTRAAYINLAVKEPIKDFR
jgi:hypothetical protein